MEDKFLEILTGMVKIMLAKFPRDMNGLRKWVKDKEDWIKRISPGGSSKYVKELLDSEKVEEEWKNDMIVRYFRRLSPADIQSWKNRRMTGLNMTWLITNKNSTKLEQNLLISNSSNMESFRNWVNTMSNEGSNRNKTMAIWNNIIGMRNKSKTEFYEQKDFQERRLPKLLFFGRDIMADLGSLKKFQRKIFNLIGDLQNSCVENCTYTGNRMLEKFYSIYNIQPAPKMIFDSTHIPDSDLEELSKMYVYLLGLPHIRSNSKVPVWQTFFDNLFSKYTMRSIIQTLSDNVKTEMKSRRNMEYVSENLLDALNQSLLQEYGKMDLLASSESNILKRKDRKQFQDLKQYINTTKYSDMKGITEKGMKI